MVMVAVLVLTGTTSTEPKHFTVEGFSICSSTLRTASRIGSMHAIHFLPTPAAAATDKAACTTFRLSATGTEEDGVVELVETSDDNDGGNVQKSEPTKAVAPFLSQGEISEEAMEMDWKDPKQARVMFYIILSLLPVLFLIPLMLGSREMIPADMLPPVELN
jgi:hypothetical protein